MGISLNGLRGIAWSGLILAPMLGVGAGSSASAAWAGEQSQAATVSRTTKAFNYRSAGGSRQHAALRTRGTRQGRRC